MAGIHYVQVSNMHFYNLQTCSLLGQTTAANQGAFNKFLPELAGY